MIIFPKVQNHEIPWCNGFAENISRSVQCALTVKRRIKLCYKLSFGKIKQFVFKFLLLYAKFTATKQKGFGNRNQSISLTFVSKIFAKNAQCFSGWIPFIENIGVYKIINFHENICEKVRWKRDLRKHLLSFSSFSMVLSPQKRNKTRSFSQETKCTRCLMSCRAV